MPEKPVPNLFLVLGLDPTKAWNQTEYERQLQKKRQEWARLVNMPTQKGIQAKQNLGLISEFQRIAADETLRKAQADEARQAQNAAQAEQIKKLDERVKMLEIRGYILEEELTLLIKDFAAVLPEVQIKSRIKVPLQKAQAAARPRAAALEPGQAKEIRIRLDALGKVDLYDFLGIGRADNARLTQRAREAYDAVQKKGSKSADDTIAAELAGHCLSIFKSDAERAKYDETLRLQAYESLKEKVDVIGQVAKRVDAKQMNELLRQAREQRLDPDEALAIIRELAAKRGFAIVETEQMVGAVKDLRRCGYCGQLNEKAKKHCVGCGQPLQEPCPKCAQPVASDESACGACGFPVGNRIYVLMLLNEGTQACSRRDWDAAVNVLEQACQAWPSAADSLGKRIKDFEAEIQPKKKMRDDLIQEVDQAIAKKHLYKARKLLPELEQVLNADSTLPRKYRSQIDPRIQQAETQLSQLRAGSGGAEQAIRGYQDVLGICQDCQEARDMLAKTPPSPPSNINATVSGQVVHLNWQPSPSIGVRYTVVRKKQSRPVAVNDGERIATVDGTLYDDCAAEVGVPAYYAVYADREGTPSKDAATLAEPVLIMQDVERVTARVADQQIHLRWQVPPNVHRVLVSRSETAYPKSINEGVPIRTLDSGQAVDNSVENNHRYFYTVFCQFLDQANCPQTTAGVHVDASPQQPPSPVRDISVTESGLPNARHLLLRWQPPSKGDVVIIKSLEPTGLEFGAVVPQVDLAKYGLLLATTANQAIDEIDRLGFCYYLPVVTFQGLGYIGSEKRYVSVEDVSELSYQNLGSALRLQWRWPNDCQEVLIAHSYSEWPTPNAAGSTTIPLTRAQYELHGYFDITNPIKANHYVIVFATVTQSGQRMIAAGENKSARALIHLGDRITITYEIKRTLVRKEFNLDLTIDGEGTMPALTLTAKQMVLPMSRLDGERVLHIETAPIRRHQSYPIPALALRRQSYARLFLDNDELYGAVLLRHPDKDKLRLF